MAVKGFTWNLDPAGASILALVLKRVAEGRNPLGIDEHIARLYFESLDSFLKGVPDGFSPTPLRSYASEEEGMG